MANAIKDQEYTASSHLIADNSTVGAGFKSSIDQLDNDVAEQTTQKPVFEVHNQIVGDKIYTAVKNKESRKNDMNSFFSN